MTSVASHYWRTVAFAGMVNVTTGGKFSPGNSPGSVTTGPATLGPGSVYRFEINDAKGTPGANWDLWRMTSLNITGQTRTTVEQYAAGHQQEILGELLSLLSIPNVASDKPNIRRNAEQLRQMLSRRGFAAEVLETDVNPLVYGELRVPTDI